MEKFREDDQKYKQEAKKFDSISKYTSPYDYVSPRYELPQVEKDTILASKRASWHRDLKKDATLAESIEILSSMK
jgi:carboxyl-terminal processing protease